MMKNTAQNFLDSYVGRNTKIIIATISAAVFVYTLILRPIVELEEEVRTIQENHLQHIQKGIDRIIENQNAEAKASLERDKTIKEIETKLDDHLQYTR